MNKSLIKLCAAASLAFPVAALAHGGHGGAGFADAFSHPFSGLDHVLAMAALGLWAATRASRRWLTPLVVLAALALGVLFGQQGVSLPRLDPLLAASVIAVGLLLAHSRLERRQSFPAVAAIAAFAVAHGLAHGSEVAVSDAALTGIVLGSAAVLSAGMALARFIVAARPQLSPRLGQAVALAGGGLVVAALF